MDEIQKAAVFFKKLLDLKISYKIIAGKKGKLYTVDILFQKDHFVHLAGLHKLDDLPNIKNATREAVFDNIISGTITDNYISKSVYYPEIKDRIAALADLENLIDNNNIIFKFYSKFNFGSMISADYLLCSKRAAQDIYIFLDKDKKMNSHFCRSFFPKGKRDYTARQSQLSLLYKEKTILGKAEIQLNKLYSYRTISKNEYEHLKKFNINVELWSKENDKVNIRYFKNDEVVLNDLLENFHLKETDPISTTNIQPTNQHLVNITNSGSATLDARYSMATLRSRPPFLREIVEKVKFIVKDLFPAFFTNGRNKQKTPQKSVKRSSQKKSHSSEKQIKQSKTAQPKPFYPLSKDKRAERAAKAIPAEKTPTAQTDKSKDKNKPSL